VFQTIVVGTDGSETAKEAVRQAAELAARTGARLHIVSAYAPISGAHVTGGEGTPERAEWRAGPDAKVEAVLADGVGACRAHGVDAEGHARQGDPAEAILEVADEQQADAVVVGSKGMTGSRRFLLGSVPDKVSHHASCVVLIVKTD
jgi:nucleotide-binding universal stress UspA family protein